MDQMATFLALVLAVSVYPIVVGRILPQAEEFQPRCSRKCGVAETPGAPDPSMPMFRCSCSPSCVLYEDCCYDSPHKNTSTRQRFDFVCLSVVGRDRYRAVSSCPSNQRSDFCKEALGHLPPVTSRKTNVTYGNVFCASCNGDRDDLIFWNVNLRCPSEDDDGTDDLEADGTRIAYGRGEFWKIDEVRKSKRRCSFHAYFGDYSILDGLELRSCDSREAVSRCSASWRDKSVVEKCRSYKDPIYFVDMAYQNPHCALCNYLKLELGDCVPFHVRSVLQTDSRVLEYCRSRGSEACVRYLSEKRRGRPFSLVDLLNVNVWECLPPDCCEGQRYDFRMKKCKKVRRGR